MLDTQQKVSLLSIFHHITFTGMIGLSKVLHTDRKAHHKKKDLQVASVDRAAILIYVQEYFFFA